MKILSAKSTDRLSATMENLLRLYIEDGVTAARSKLVKLQHTIPQSFKTVKHPVYRGALCLNDLEDFLVKGGVFKDHPITSWSYDAREAANFCVMSSKRGLRHYKSGVILRQLNPKTVVINFPDNIARFGADLRDTIEYYAQDEILLLTEKFRYKPSDIAAVCIRKEAFSYYNKAMGWKLKAVYGAKAFALVVNPTTNAQIAYYR